MLSPFAIDNEAIVAVTAATAAHEHPGTTRFIRDAVIKGTWETLLVEGKPLPFHDPEPEDLAAFFRYQRDLVERVTEPRLRADLLAQLDAAEVNTGAYLKPHVLYTWQHLNDLTSYTLARQTSPAPLTIAIDLDGCLYDFIATMRDWLISRGWDASGLTDPTQYYVQREWGINDKVFQEEMMRSLHHGIMFRTGGAFNDAIEGARALGLAGHTLLANSARLFPGMEDKSRSATLQWLRENGIHPDAIHLADPHDPKDKLAASFDLLIDDHPGNVEATLAAGRGAVLLDRPWNADRTDLPRATYAQIAADPHQFV